MRKLMALAIGLGGFIFVSLAFAGDGHSHDSHAHSHGASTHAKTAAELLLDLEKLIAEISSAVSAKELSKLHDLTGEINHIASHIPEQISGPNQARVKGSSANIAQLADKMHIDADKGDQAGVEAGLKRLEGMLAVLKAQIAQMK